MVLELDDIQGNILRGYTFGRGVHLFVEFPDARAGRAFLNAIAGEVETAAPWRSDAHPLTALNVALTCAGLQRLGVDATSLPGAFSEPIAQRAERLLGDDVDQWHGELGRGRAHALLLVAGPAAGTALAARVDRLTEQIERHRLKVVFRQEVEALEDQREHFGFADGLGQPAVEGTHQRYAGQGDPGPFGSWRDLKAGEFLHGYMDEDEQTEQRSLLRNGTFMVYRKLEQDVTGFRRFLDREADHYCARVGVNHGTDPATAHAYARELVAAKLMGRWRDGVAVSLEPERDPDEARDLRHHARKLPDNDFRYGDDQDGRRCPVGAHVRRTNPRDTKNLAAQTRRHRIIRRGMPYVDEAPDGDGERGLVFICFNADLERQFETIQRHWCEDGNAFGLGEDRDVLFANPDGSGKLRIPGDPPHIAPAQPGLVTTRGCEYLLMPGLQALRALAQGGDV